MLLKFVFRIVAFFALIVLLPTCERVPKRVLVFSKTAGFRHASIEAGKTALLQLGRDHHFQVDTTEDASFFTEPILKQYAAVVFLNTTGDVLDYPQQADFERFIQAGGGYVGIHSATDTEYDWAWYNKLAGAYFNGHPRIQEATLQCVNHHHPATEALDSTWQKTEEWYNFRNMNPDINVLLTIDEQSYEGGNHGTKDHPMSWYHDYDGGRAFYTGIGHLSETFQDSTFLKHLLGGIQYAMGEAPLNYDLAYSQRVPEENRFAKEILDFNLDEPMEIDEWPGKGMLFIERRGAVKLFDFAKAATQTIGQLNVFYANEDGLLGLAVDPNFSDNHWIYLFYSAPGEVAEQHVSRFEVQGDSLLLSSEKILLTIPVLRECCHSGGALEFDAHGNLLIGLGDNTNPFESDGYAPIDERPERALWDAQKSAANTNDLRGKILRIRPQADGTYTIPEGNLFAQGTPKTRPEIYAMGLRNPFRFSVDSKTNYVYWGDVGPDAGVADSLRGPHGMGEFNQARAAGFWGWPYSRGNNQAYHDYDFAQATSGEKFILQKIINDSPNNTGLAQLPPAMPSMIWYSYAKTAQFPWLGEGGVNPMAGPVFHAADFPQAKHTFPNYFENKLFVYEWMRDWIFVLTLDDQQNYVKSEAFMPSTKFSHPMDMLFGTDGYLYVLEYGQKWNAQNIDARLSRIRYLEGNRPPLAKMEVDQIVGAAPLTVQFSAAKSKDYDQEELSYEWYFTGNELESRELNPSFTFVEEGIYDVQLKVIDRQGESSTTNEKIMVGNSKPQLEIALDSPDSTYWNHKKVAYQIRVDDREDGSKSDASIDPQKVKVTWTYLPEGEDLILATLGHQQNTVPKGLELINNSDCWACHAKKEKVNGPSYLDIAKKYDRTDQDYLISTVIKGGTGIWGNTMMSAHPQLSIDEVEEMVKYILSLDEVKNQEEQNLPIRGTLEFTAHLKDEDLGQYVLMASYRDEGNAEQEGFALSTRKKVVFKAPKLQAEHADGRTEGLGTWESHGNTLVGSIVHNTFLKFENQNLLDLRSIKLAASYSENYNYQGKVEVREQSPSGKLIGQMQVGYFNEEKWSMKYYDIPVRPSLETGDLYLVFKNPGDEKQFVLNADWILMERI
ncbi:MAG: ThuA domain-containing protein [Bacteroidota bacterium]